MLSILVHAASPFIPSAEKYFDYIMKMVDSNMDAGPRKKKKYFIYFNRHKENLQSMYPFIKD